MLIHRRLSVIKFHTAAYSSIMFFKHV